MRKVTIIGGGGVRAPLLIHGLAQAQELLNIGELTLFDVDIARIETIARIGREIVRQMGAGFKIRVTSRLEEAADGAEFVLSSIRVGGMAGRARDERLSIEHGLAGQETTGPAGAAMALRTIPVTLGQANVVERVAPGAWFINFTNPAGLITQALTQNTSLKVIGICDTPSDVSQRVAALTTDKQCILFSGLAPGWFGLYQINIPIPPRISFPAFLDLQFGAYEHRVVLNPQP